MVEEELEVVTDELWSIVMNANQRSRVTTQPCVFDCALCLERCLVGHRTNFEKVSYRVNDCEGDILYGCSGNADAPWSDRIDMDLLPGNADGFPGCQFTVLLSG